MKNLMVMCFGDSITYGYCAEYGTDYVSLFKKKAAEDFPEGAIKMCIRDRGHLSQHLRFLLMIYFP